MHEEKKRNVWIKVLFAGVGVIILLQMRSHEVAKDIRAMALETNTGVVQLTAGAFETIVALSEQQMETMVTVLSNLFEPVEE
jgi:hypothetical protein|tara:strand:+ start:713 stop:958 length:246 start_codon:yes stop_codon:yes gene_type:complete